MDNFGDMIIDFDDFGNSTSTSCNNPIKPITKEKLNKAMMAMKVGSFKLVKPDFKFNMRHTLGFNSTVFSRIHTI